MTTSVFKSDQRVTFSSALVVRKHNYHKNTCEVYQISEVKDTDVYNNASYLATLYNRNRGIISPKNRRETGISVRYLTSAALRLGDSEFAFALSVHNPVDVYDKHEGRKIALSRLNRAFLGRQTEEKFVWLADYSVTAETTKIKIYPFMPGARIQYPIYEEVLDSCDLRFGTVERPDFRTLSKVAYKLISDKVSQSNPKYDLSDFRTLLK
jgi:hypothetical protein